MLFRAINYDRTGADNLESFLKLPGFDMSERFGSHHFSIASKDQAKVSLLSSRILVSE